MSLLPPSTNQDYAGSRASAWFLALAAVLTLLPGAIHSFMPDGGAQTIAGLDIGNRPELVRSLFAWEGATQLAYGLILLLVALRYQPLVPVMLITILVERGLMALQGWVLRPPTNGHHPPEHFASLIVLPLAAVFLALSLRARRR